MNYSQIEKEGLVIIFAIKKFHNYVHDREFILQTDHRPLLAIFGSKKGIPIHTVHRLQRWATMLLNYSFKMEFLPSKEIAHADGLSRLIPKKYRTARGDRHCFIKVRNGRKMFYSIQLKNFQLG